MKLTGTDVMKKTMMNVSIAAALIASGVNVAHAGNDLTVTMKGSIDTVSCNISADGATSTKDILLGNFIPADFKQGTGPFASFYTAGTEKKFSVKVSDCVADANASTSATSTLKLRVNGNTLLASNGRLFNNNGSATAGATLRNMGADGNNTGNELLKDQDTVDLKKSTGAENKLSGDSIVYFGTQMASMGEKPATQQVIAPVTFTVAYN